MNFFLSLDGQSLVECPNYIKAINESVWLGDGCKGTCVKFGACKPGNTNPLTKMTSQVDHLLSDQQSQCVGVKGATSQPLPVLSGVPQDSLLGPLVFTMSLPMPSPIAALVCIIAADNLL